MNIIQSTEVKVAKTMALTNAVSPKEIAAREICS